MKTYLFITDTVFSNNNLTGAHRRFIELVNRFSEDNKIILISPEIPQLQESSNIKRYIIEKEDSRIPHHINGMILLCKKLSELKSCLEYDYAISFHATNTICYYLCGYSNIISLFREDLIEYRKILSNNIIKNTYFRIIEILSVRASKKIFVQCLNDKINLIKRNYCFCNNVSNKVHIQINNINTSWMPPYTEIKTYHEKKVSVNILFIGNFSDARKGHKVFLEAVSNLIDDGFVIKVFIAGNGKELDLYKNKYKDYAQLIFLGRVHCMKKYIDLCDFEVVPSLIDSCPNTILEALNIGLPVYGSNKGGIPDLLLDSNYMFSPNSKSIYNFLKDVIENKKYINDQKKQQYLKKRLTFDWGKKIMLRIEEN